MERRVVQVVVDGQMISFARSALCRVGWVSFEMVLDARSASTTEVAVGGEPPRTFHRPATLPKPRPSGGNHD